MDKVNGSASYNIAVTCPKCKSTFSAIEQDDDSLMASAMFKNTEESCTNMDIDIVCLECGHDFILDSISY